MSDGWRRLDPRMLLIHPLETLVRLLPALVAVFIARLGSDGNDRWELLALPVIVAYGVLRWLTTRYRVAGGQIELRRGLLNKQTTTARLDKVRTVDLRAGRWEREGHYPLTHGTLRGRRAGIFGMGRIGLAIARRLEALGLSIAYHNRRRVEGVGYTHYPTLIGLAEAVDTLISVAPGGPYLFMFST